MAPHLLLMTATIGAPVAGFTLNSGARNMLKKSLAILVLSICAVPALAENPRVEISPFIGFRLEGEFDSGTFDDFFNPFDDLNIASGESYGIVADFAIGRNFMFELIATRQESEVELNTFVLLPNDNLFDVDLDYLHAGFIYQWRPGQVQPFLGMSVGLTRIDPNTREASDLDRPSFSLGGGAKLMFTDHFGVRLEGRIFWTYIDDDVGDFCNCGVRDDSVYLVQPELRGGLIFAF